MAEPGLAGVEAHPDLELAGLGPRLRRDRPLGGNGRLCRAIWILERGEERVTLGLDDDPAVRLDRPAQERVVARHDRGPVVRSDLLLEARRALDVREEKGDGWTSRQRHVAGNGRASRRRRLVGRETRDVLEVVVEGRPDDVAHLLAAERRVKARPRPAGLVEPHEAIDGLGTAAAEDLERAVQRFRSGTVPRARLRPGPVRLVDAVPERIEPVLP